MALFGGNSKIDKIEKQLMEHHILYLVERMLKKGQYEETNDNNDRKWIHCVEDYYDDGVRSVYVYRDYVGILRGKPTLLTQPVKGEKEQKEIDYDGFSYTAFGYEPISGYGGIGYREIMKSWINVVRERMMAMYPQYKYSNCSLYDNKQAAQTTNALHFDVSLVGYFTYTLPRPCYKPWFQGSL